MGNRRLLALLAGAALLLSGCAAPEPSQPPPLLSWDDRVLSGLPWPEELALSLPEEAQEGLAFARGLSLAQTGHEAVFAL